MNLLGLNDSILYGKKEKVKYMEVTDEQLVLFQQLINVDQTVKQVFDSTDDVISFLSVYPDIKQIMSQSVAVECFYATKLGYLYPGVPMRLVFILSKAFKEFGKDYVNRTLNIIHKFLAPYAGNEYVCGEDTFDLRDIIENILGRSVNLLTESKRKIQSGDCCEVFIPGVDRVALVPKDIMDRISLTDCENLKFDEKLGITIYDTPLRTFGVRLGITKSDFDLRECI